MLFSEFAEIFLKLKRARISVTTFASYEAILNNNLLPLFGSFDLSSLRRLDVQLFVNGLVDAGLSPATVARIFSVLRQLIRKAVSYDELETAKAVEEIELPRRIKSDLVTFSVSECRELLSSASSEPLKWQIFLLLALDTGARRGELVALQWRDIDFKAGTVRIERAAYRANGVVGLKEPKGHTSRTIFIGKHTLNLLKELRIAQGLINRCAFVVSDDGKMLYPTSPTRWWSSFLCKNSLQQIKLHALRHTCATLLMSNGVPLAAVQRRLGHADMKTTFIYLHCPNTADKEATEVLEKILYL